jgi:hypothetical protein
MLTQKRQHLPIMENAGQLRLPGGWMDHICPPARFDTLLLFIDVNNALAGWMHRMCADLAGCYENSVWCSVRLRWSVA